MTGVHGFNNLNDTTRQRLLRFWSASSRSWFSLWRCRHSSSPWNGKQTRSITPLHSCVTGSYVRILCGISPVSFRLERVAQPLFSEEEYYELESIQGKEYEGRKHSSRLKYEIFHSEWVIRECWDKLGLPVHVVKKRERSSKMWKRLFWASRKLSRRWTTKQDREGKLARRSHGRSKNNKAHM